MFDRPFFCQPSVRWGVRFLCVFTSLQLGACAALSVTGPPPAHRELPQFDCTTEDYAPALDVVFAVSAGIGVIGGASEASNGDGDLGTVSMVASGALLLTHVVSAGYGYATTRACREARIDAFRRGAGLAPAGTGDGGVQVPQVVTPWPDADRVARGVVFDVADPAGTAVMLVPAQTRERLTVTVESTVEGLEAGCADVRFEVGDIDWALGGPTRHDTADRARLAGTARVKAFAGAAQHDAVVAVHPCGRRWQLAPDQVSALRRFIIEYLKGER